MTITPGERYTTAIPLEKWKILDQRRSWAGSAQKLSNFNALAMASHYKSLSTIKKPLSHYSAESPYSRR